MGIGTSGVGDTMGYSWKECEENTRIYLESVTGKFGI